MRLLERRARRLRPARRRSPLTHRTPTPVEPIADTPVMEAVPTAPVTQQQPAVPWHMPRISVARAGRYVISEAGSPRAGSIYGDYVIGFTVRYRNRHRRFASMAEASQFVGEVYDSRHELAVQAS